MSDLNPYQSNSQAISKPVVKSSRSLLQSAILGAVSAAIVPFFFALFSTFTVINASTNARLVPNFRIWIVVVVVTAGMGALLGIAVGLFRRTLVRIDRKPVD